KPDQAKYNAEQDGYNKEIAIIKTKQDSVRARISLIQPARENDRRSQLKIEMDSLRSEQGKYKSERQKTLDELKKLQEIVGKKIKDAQGTKSKMGFRSVNEVEERISALNAQVESGTMKLVDERKALAELSTLRRSRKALESSGSVEDSIAADRARIDELRKILDDPEVKKITDKYDELKKESDGLREEGDKAYAERNKLFDERNALSAQLDEIYKKKRESAQAFREENDRYYAKIQADQKARQDRLKAERAKEDAIKREAEIVRLREEAKIPAFSSEIDDCQVLINWFKGKYGGNEIPTIQAIKSTTTTVEGVKTLEIRRVEGDFEGMTLKKKGDDDLEGFFGGSGKNKKKGKKISLPNSGIATPSEGGVGGSVNLPMSLLTALLSLGIPPPTGKDDVQRTMNDLETKKAWYEANSATKT
ncbi:hypothetical protein TREMEDRAFT_22121, partial [Tremella mesenterica DSM 1558]|uniref:uncharacterized protein n=1 Tax=Tremella mesenterica (strain ATCC 24925 / CBS 8224 / DSM 1558 / NBRC 9311 / NRRL Y-6157 / RJB 2259-6 / UBC 559-6) TaxID=578456 RepID=UPI0003F4A3D6